MRQKFAFLVLLWLAEVAVIYCSETEKRNNNGKENVTFSVIVATVVREMMVMSSSKCD